MAEAEELKKALDLLGFWATCFDYKRYTKELRDKCRNAEDLLNEFRGEMQHTSKYSIGQKVSPVLDDNIVMQVEAITFASGVVYNCWWFIDGKIEKGTFTDLELKEAKTNGSVGYGTSQDAP